MPDHFNIATESRAVAEILADECGLPRDQIEEAAGRIADVLCDAVFETRRDQGCSIPRCTEPVTERFCTGHALRLSLKLTRQVKLIERQRSASLGADREGV